MVREYGLPMVLHFQERDVDGNRRTVRYFRETVITDFVLYASHKAKKILESSDLYDAKTDAALKKEMVEWREEATDGSAEKGEEG